MSSNSLSHTHSLPHTLLPPQELTTSSVSQPSPDQIHLISLDTSTVHLAKSCQLRRALPTSVIHLMSFINYWELFQVLRFPQHSPRGWKWGRVRAKGRGDMTLTLDWHPSSPLFSTAYIQCRCLSPKWWQKRVRIYSKVVIMKHKMCVLKGLTILHSLVHLLIYRWRNYLSHDQLGMQHRASKAHSSLLYTDSRQGLPSSYAHEPNPTSASGDPSLTAHLLLRFCWLHSTAWAPVFLIFKF